LARASTYGLSMDDVLNGLRRRQEEAQ